MHRVVPHRLAPGAAIGVVSPADPAEVDPFLWNRACEYFAARRYSVVTGERVSTRTGHSSGTTDERVADFMRMIRDPKIGLVMASVGGFNSHQLLPYLGYEEIRSNPKPISGFSDITALLLGIYRKTGLTTFLGPTFMTFGQLELPSYTERCFFSAVTSVSGGHSVGASDQWADDEWHRMPEFGPREWQPNAGWQVYRPGIAEGIAIGGNLSTLLLLAGTEFFPEFHEAILFVEEDGTATPAVVDRYLTQLRHIGVFESIRGLVIGRFPRSVQFTPTDSLEMILDEALRGRSFPVIYGADISHTDPLMTIPIGVACRIDTDTRELQFLEASVR